MVSSLGILLILLIGGATLIGTVALMVALLSNSKTRPIGLGVLLILGLLVIGVPVTLSFVWSARMESREQAARQKSVRARDEIIRSFQSHPEGISATPENSAFTKEESGPLDDLFGSPALIPLGLEESESNKKDPHSPGTAPEPDETPDETPDGAKGKLPKASNALRTSLISKSKGSANSKTGSNASPAIEGLAKPDWVLHPPKRVGGEMRRVVDAGPYKTVDECQQEIDRRIGDAMWEFLTATLGLDRGVVTTSDAYEEHPMQQLDINPLFVRGHLCQDEFIETVESPSLGEMKRVYVLMQFDTKLQEELRTKWKVVQAENALRDSKHERRWRMAEVGAVATFVLSLLGIVWGSFKLDTVTKGFYTKRLIFGAIAATIGAGLLACEVSDSVYTLLR